MKPLISFFLLLLTTVISGQSVQFIKSGKLEDAQTVAKSSGKLIFVDVYADWCGPCKKMDSDIFADIEIAERMNGLFVNLKANAELGGTKIAQKYEVKAYPTFLILNEDGTLAYTFHGYMPREYFLLELNAALETAGYSTIFLDLEKAWNEGPHGYELAFAYIGVRHGLGMPTDKILKSWLREIPADSLLTPGTIKLVARFTNKLGSTGHHYLQENRQEPRCMRVLQGLIQQEFKQCVADKDKKRLKTVLEAAQNAGADEWEGEVQRNQLEMAYFLETKQAGAFHRVCRDFLPQKLLPTLCTTPDDPQLRTTLENITWQYATYIRKKADLKEFHSWLSACPEDIFSPAARNNLLIIQEKM